MGSGAGCGGACIGYGVDLMLENNVISDNHVVGIYGGLAISGQDLTLSENTIANNSSGYFAGGLGID